MISRCPTALLLAVAAVLDVSINAGSLPVSLDLTESVIMCPDKGQCTDGSTCCLKSDGLYGCCAYKNAVCCPGTHHCCPSNSLCHADGCVADQSGVLNTPKMIEAATINKQTKQKIESETNLICPDGSSCQGLQSCCKSASGYRCCPYDHGSCCADGLRCCSAGRTCVGTICIGSSDKDSSAVIFIQAIQTQGNKKSDQTVVLEAQKLIEAATVNKQAEEKIDSEPNLICPDFSSCPEGQSCCRNASDYYRCCPYDHGICCADGLHCCPFGCHCVGTICNGSSDSDSSAVILIQAIQTQDNQKSDQTGVLKVQKLLEAVTVNKQAEEKIESEPNLDCPDGSSCVFQQSCCLNASGTGYRCCPYEFGTCCADRLHCCPFGCTCVGTNCIRSSDNDSSAIIFIQGIQPQGNKKFDQTEVLEAQKLNEAVIVNKQAEEKIESESNLVCPDGSSCPGQQTCCHSASGYHCCPYDQGICCADGLHCCPFGCHCVGNICHGSNDNDSSAVIFIQAIQTQGNKKSQL